MYAAPSLEVGVAQITALTGVEAEFGGRHDGAGTHNALLSLGSDQYLEIIAPDPDQSSGGAFVDELQAITQPLIRTWAVATNDFDAVNAVEQSLGFTGNVIDMQRTRPDGVQLAWRLLFVGKHPFGLTMLFFIDWLQSPHPAADTPTQCTLNEFSVQCPNAGDLQPFFDQIGLECQVDNGERAMRAQLESPNGSVLLK